MNPKDMRDERIVIETLPPFLMDAEGASVTYTFLEKDGNNER